MQSEAIYTDSIVFKKLRFLGAIAQNEDFFKDSAFYYIIAVHIYILLSFDTGGYIQEIFEPPTM